jgi:hypothetical protein
MTVSHTQNERLQKEDVFDVGFGNEEDFSGVSENRCDTE